MTWKPSFSPESTKNEISSVFKNGYLPGMISPIGAKRVRVTIGIMRVRV